MQILDTNSKNSGIGIAIVVIGAAVLIAVAMWPQPKADTAFVFDQRPFLSKHLELNR